jgi:predicted nucleic acid-binding protein
MSDRVFLDSNILVYAYDRHEPNKQAAAQAILREGLQEDRAVLSAQVLSEFFVVVTHRVRYPLSADEALEAIRLFSTLTVMPIEAVSVETAIELHKRHHISYWDALILTTARQAGCQRILTEDLNVGQKYDGVRVENPFVG